MAGKNDQRLAVAKLFACCLRATPEEILPPFEIDENCSLVMNAYFPTILHAN